MLKAVQGIYRNGRIELLESVLDQEETEVVVTFLPRHLTVDLASKGINTEQARDLRHRLGSFAEDWDRPEMGVYDSH